MAILNKRDLAALFILLAVIYLLDGFSSHFLLLGVAVFIIMVVLAWYSQMPESQKFIKNQQDSTLEWLIRIGIALMLLGVLLLNAWLIAIGFLVAEATLFVPNGGLEVDLWHVAVHAIKTGAVSKKTTKKKS